MSEKRVYIPDYGDTRSKWVSRKINKTQKKLEEDNAKAKIAATKRD